MKKLLSFLLTVFLLNGCTSQSKKETPPTNPVIQTSISDERLRTGKTNFAVTWKWTTTDSKLVSNSLPVISEELLKLWKSSTIENAYFDTESSTDKFEHFANIAFFLKADSKEEAEHLLNNLEVVKKGIASYQLYPVGVLWLGRKTEAVKKKSNIVSFATVWTTKVTPKPSAKLIKEQSAKISELWNQGVVENVYFDIEGTQSQNEVTDFVFFVNARSQEEAQKICNSLPFYKEGIASYEMYQAGAFWMGRHEDQ